MPFGAASSNRLVVWVLTGKAIDGFADEIRVTCVARVLLDQVQQDPPQVMAAQQRLSVCDETIYFLR